MQYDYGAGNVESHAMLTIGFEHGASAVVDCGSMHFSNKPKIQAFGDKASFIKYGLDPQEGAMNREAIDEAIEPPENYGRLIDSDGERVIPTIPGRWRNYYESIADQITGMPASVPFVRFEEMRRVMAVFDAAFKSAKENRVINLNIPALSESN
jgi:scyllo-inositol 2-dehydrogenase (NADP+)